MIVSDVSINNTFKAFYMPPKRDIIGRQDLYYSNIINFVKPNFEKLAKDVDIHIKNRKGLINIKVGQVVKSPVKRFFGFLGSTVERNLEINYGLANFVDIIIANVLDAKEEYNRYKEYYTH